MATSKELLKDAANGAEVRVNAVNVGGLVAHRPRYKGDREPWMLREGLHVYRYTAAKCVAVWPEAPATEEVKEEGTVTNSNITPEVVEALAILRKRVRVHGGPTFDFFNVLDNAGIFSAVDEASDYATDQAPEQVSKCTCPAQDHGGKHAPACPGDPAEWGDMAFGPVRTAADNIRNAVGLKW